jgi:hypothetical protein
VIHISRIKAVVAAVTVTGATAAAMILPASQAVAFSSGGLALDVLVQSPAQLIAKGAAVGVPVLYTCSPGATDVGLSVDVTERVSGNAIASGSAQLPTISCTGEIKSATIDVPATSARAFAKGTAFATGAIFGCTSNFLMCGNQTNNQTITIK